MTDELCDIVPISNKRYQELLEAEKLLGALEAAGVDNWEGYSEAFRYLEDESYEG